MGGGSLPVVCFSLFQYMVRCDKETIDLGLLTLRGTTL